MNEDQFTLDSIWNDEKIKIRQPVGGYRFALDAVLLAHFLKISKDEEGLEIGSGSGVITILLSRLQTFQKIVAVEIQPALAALSAENFKLNSISNVQVLEINIQDLKTVLPNSRFDLIFSNPPYRKSGTGKLNSSGQKAIARHEVKMRLEDVFVCAKTFLKPNGRLSVILPDFREADFMNLAARYDFHWMEKRYVYSFRQESPAFLLASLSPVPANFTEHPPLVIYESPGKYTLELQRMLKDELSHG